MINNINFCTFIRKIRTNCIKIKNIEKDAAIIVKSKKEDVAHVYYNESYQADNNANSHQNFVNIVIKLKTNEKM